jgi:periplasmic divalent cation tolerance protein
VTSEEPCASLPAVASQFGVLLTTAPSRDEAAKIANLLIGEKLAACVQLLPIESFYVWQGKTQNEAEVLLLVKTRATLFESVITRIKAVHSYSAPEIVATVFTAGFQGYFDWIDDVTADGNLTPGATKS